MHSTENDKLISQLTVRIIEPDSQHVIGTGILINQDSLDGKIYFVSAAHCFYEDKDSFQKIRSSINIEIYKPDEDKYIPLNLHPQENFLFKDIEKDLGIIWFEKSEIDFEIPKIKILKERHSFTDFIVKGFPQATQGQEIDTIFPKWKQTATVTKTFNLELLENYNSYNVEGFSGSGVFLIADQEIYLFGIFTRYRPEERGKVIYCQFIETIDEIIKLNYLPTLTYSYIGSNGLTHKFFKDNIEKSISNLGERFSKELNFKLPIAHRFNELAKDDTFKEKLLKIFDEWLTDRDINRSSNLPEIQTIEKELQILRDKLIEWEKQNPIKVDNQIDLDWFFSELENLNITLEKSISHFYDIGWKDDKGTKKNKNTYESEISRLREISRKNHKLKSDFNSGINLKLVNKPFLIIRGEAGCGKSHLLGDVANNRLKKNLPTILLLGQLFNSSITIEQNILLQLGLSCNFIDFLSGFDSIGKQIGSRVIILIDAINETSNGEIFWKSQILGLISQVSKFSYIGISFTIRDTYWEYTLPDNIGKSTSIIVHEAFKGNEYEALKMFCGHFGLEQPNFPILSQEFSNPLFLKLCCSGVANSGAKIFPSGFNGINQVFEYYINSIYSKIAGKREYRLRKKIVWDAISIFAKKCIDQNDRHIKIEKAIELFKNNFPDCSNLLVDLVEEGLFIKSISQYYKDENGKYAKDNTEIIYFAYERLGDYLIAGYELDIFTDKENLKLAFLEDGKFGKYPDQHYYSNGGILEAFSVILPEKYSLELFEVYQWIFDNHNKEVDNRKRYKLRVSCEHINNLLLKSFKWRTIDSIDDTKITDYFQTTDFQIDLDYDYFLSIILELSCIENHPMNSDRLHRILIHHKMPARDSFWQKFIINHSANSDDGNALPIKRLLDFAWQSNISFEVNDQTCRLVGQTLTWVLATTNTILRDKITKALVNLLEQKPHILLEILNKFKKVDDLYILERLYAVSYGVILRTNSDEGIALIAQYTYNTIFKNKKIPTHILLRDYARNIVEYALYKSLKIKVNPERIRPPYQSVIPKLPTKEEMKKYEIHYDSEKYIKNPEYARLYSRAHFSTLEWDFGRKVVDAKIDDFYPISFTQEPIYKEYLKGRTTVQKSWLRVYRKIFETKHLLERNDYHIKQKHGEEFYKKQMQHIVDSEKELINKIEELSLFPESEREFVRSSILPYLKIKEKLKSQWSYTQNLNPEPFKRWIVERVHKLGYDVKKHSEYELYYTNFDGSQYSYHIERISKKYQWIALYEILGIITDNYKMKTGMSRTNPYEYYKGTWQNYLRDIDPAYINLEEENEEEEFENYSYDVEKKWHDDVEYKYWNMLPSEWVSSTDDLPKINAVITKTDDKGEEWLYLQKYVEWVEPKMFGDDKYDRERKEFWYLIQGYIIKRTDKKKIYEYLRNESFWGRWMPENRDTYSTLINREKFWSPADIDETKINNYKEWVNIPDTNYKVIVASTGAKGTMEEDKSGANKKYNIPCKTIFEGLKLQYHTKDGDFIDEFGEIVVTNSSSKGVLIKKNKLLEFLSKNNLEILWTVLSEKNAKIEKTTMGKHLFGEFSGVFNFNKDKIEGSLNLRKKRKNF